MLRRVRTADRPAGRSPARARWQERTPPRECSTGGASSAGKATSPPGVATARRARSQPQCLDRPQEGTRITCVPPGSGLPSGPGEATSIAGRPPLAERGALGRVHECGRAPAAGV
jgi:hypothetical protein